MNPTRKAAWRHERMMRYRAIGSGGAVLLTLGAVIATQGLLPVGWRIAGFLMIFLAYPIGELIGGQVATRGLSETDVGVLHALRFIEDGDTNGSTLRGYYAEHPERVEAWLRTLEQVPQDVLGRRAIRAREVLRCP